MEIKELSAEAKLIWSGEKLPLAQIIVRMGKIFGDICRWERNELKDIELHKEAELKKELGNMIFSTIKWCDQLGYEPEECIKLAIEAQKKYPKEQK